MQNLRILAITDDAGQMALLKSGGKIGDQDFMVITHGMLHALAVPETLNWPWLDPERVKIQKLIDYHRMLGLVTQIGKVIPASFDTVFSHETSVIQALSQHQRDIVDLLSRYGSTRQFSLTVHWDAASMQQLACRHSKEQELDINKERRFLRDQILLQLQRCLQDIIILENSDQSVVIQAIILINANDEEKMVRILQLVDDECKNRLDMRLIGPLPACNFARVEIKVPNQSTVRQACRDLGIQQNTRLSDIKTAYRQRVKSLHPDSRMAVEKNDVMVRLTQSYRYLTRLAAQQNVGEENNPEKQWLRVDSKTLRHTPLLNIQRGMTRFDDAILKQA